MHHSSVSWDITLSFFSYIFSSSIFDSWIFHIRNIRKSYKTVTWYAPQTSKQIYSKLKNREKVFGEFQPLPRFSRKMILYSSIKFGTLRPWTNIPKLIRFDLSFWQTSKQIYRKPKYKKNRFGKFQSLPSSPRKMLLYLSIKFLILKPWTNIL